jgi:prepilin-type N-terminal cleavage/methylation domain-containing protein
MSEKQRGFSLVEVLVVIAIMLIMGTVAVPTLVDALPSYRLKKSARDLCTQLRKARAAAVKQNRDVVIRFNIGGLHYTVDNINVKLEEGITFGHGNSSRPAGTKFPSDGVSFNGNKIVFNARGLISSNSGYVYLQNEQMQTCAISATTAGIIALKTWTGKWQ